jgi:ABC-type multidrug transport system fused ATPase/permease subunit
MAQEKPSPQGARISIRKYSRLLSHYLRPQGWLVAALAAAILSNIALQLISPQILRRFVDAATSAAVSVPLLALGLLYMGVSLLQQVINLTSVYLSETVGWNATNALRADLVEHCIDLDMSFHSSRTPGEMIERVDGDVNSMANFFSQFAVQIFGNMILLVGVLVMLFSVDWRAGAAIGVFVAIAAAVLWRVQNVATPAWAAERQASAELFGFLEERLNGTEDIRANGAGPYVLRRFFQLSRELMKRTVRAGLMVNIIVNSSMILFAIGTAVGMAVAAYLFINGRITIGTAVMILNLTNIMAMPIERILNQLQDLQRSAASINRVTELLDIAPQIIEQLAPEEGGLLMPPGPFEVDFSHVTFSYEKEGQKVLDHLDFRIPKGKVLGLLGRTGSGKTTLARVLFRLFDPDSGVIRLGGKDLRDLTTGELRQRVGLVSQNIQLFHAKLRDNLTFFDPAIPDERVRTVLEQLGLSNWLNSLPYGLDTELESGGGSLSAGEAQLLAFARIFLKTPGLVILDEATSRLDPASEALIERAVDRLVQDSTAIIIAHRLGTVERADLIMILEDGGVVEFGSRAALAADSSSRFSSLLQTGLEEVLA